MHASWVQFAVSAMNVVALVRVTRKLPPFDVTSAMLPDEASGDEAPTLTVTPDAPRLPFTVGSEVPGIELAGLLPQAGSSAASPVVDARHLQKSLRL